MDFKNFLFIIITTIIILFEFLAMFHIIAIIIAINLFLIIVFVDHFENSHIIGIIHIVPVQIFNYLNIIDLISLIIISLNILCSYIIIMNLNFDFNF